jgi:Gtr1/RagA G protein conserved region
MERLQRIPSLSHGHKNWSKQSLSAHTYPASVREGSHAKHRSILPLELWDSPGKEDITEDETLQLLREVNAVVFVIDINVCQSTLHPARLTLYTGLLVQCHCTI